MKTSYAVVILFILILVSHCAYSQLWKQYADSAIGFNNQHNNDKAIELYTKVKEELKKDSLGTSSYAGMCDSLANLYTKISQYEKAKPLCIESKQIREKLFGKMSAEYAASSNRL